MTIFSCLRRKSGSTDVQSKCSIYHEDDTFSKAGATVVPTVNARFMELLHALSSLEGGGLPVLSDACKATCEQLEAEQVCVSLLGADHSATVVACAGLDAELALGRRLSSGLLGSGYMTSSVVGAALHVYEASPAMPVAFRESRTTTGYRNPPHTPDSRASRELDARDRDRDRDRSRSSAPHGLWTSSSSAATRSATGIAGPLPDEWQQLASDHKLTQFAAAVMVVGGVPVGILTLAAKGPSRPACWTVEVIQSIAVLLAGHIRLQGQQMADALSLLHSASTLSEVVEAVGDAAVEVARAVAHIGGQARVAFMQPDGSAAAIFQQQLRSQQSGDVVASVTAGMPSPLVTRSRRTSCELIMPSVGGSSRKGIRSRMSMDATGFANAVNRAASSAAQNQLLPDDLRPHSMTELSLRKGRLRQSFTMPPSGKGSSCKGHTLPLSGTLLAEALVKEAAGLCVSDCASYVQDNKAFPRDTVLSRDGVMPLSLALATASHDGKPLMAIYLTYTASLPKPLLQAVVQELQQLLQAILPIIRDKLAGELRNEWDYLRAQLGCAMGRKGTGESTTPPSTLTGHLPVGTVAFPAASDSDPSLSASAGADITVGKNLVGGANGAVVRPPSVPQEASFTFNGGPGNDGTGSSGCRPGGDVSGNSPFTTGTAAATAAGAASPQRRRLSLLGPTRSEGPSSVGGGNVRPASAIRRLLGMNASEGAGNGCCGTEANNTPSAAGSVAFVGEAAEEAEDGMGELDSAGSASRSAPNRRLMQAIKGVSFKLEAARAPRGASRLAPIITIMHERLKAAQAAQMTGNRSEARKADLQSVKLMQEIGKGGYGTVYRGTYHGAEVAIKVIQEKELAALQTVNGDIHAHSSSLLLHKQNIHDAIELVASVSVSHPNIVQVLTFFTDCKLQLPESSNIFDSMDIDAAGGAAKLVHMPSILESPAPGQDMGGGISVALVMEYMDAGCLSDAIQNRVFFERLDPPPSSTGRPGKGLLAVSMRSVYATLLEIALALRHMHSLHLVHCDLKPQNVLLKTAPRDPRGFTAKLSDFGLAKTMAHDENGQLVIDEAVGSGTITHIAPEVFMGKKSLGAAVDIYAFGIIMYQVLCGMRLYEGMSAQEIANSVAFSMMRPVLPAWVPSNYRALAERCWHQVASVRPTADELVRQLERLSDFKRSKQARPQSGYQQ